MRIPTSSSETNTIGALFFFIVGLLISTIAWWLPFTIFIGFLRTIFTLFLVIGTFWSIGLLVEGIIDFDWLLEERKKEMSWLNDVIEKINRSSNREKNFNKS